MVFYNNIVIHVVDQMYESDWFSKNTVTEWKKMSTTTKQRACAKSSLRMHTSQKKVQ